MTAKRIRALSESGYWTLPASFKSFCHMHGWRHVACKVPLSLRGPPTSASAAGLADTANSKRSRSEALFCPSDNDGLTRRAATLPTNRA